MNTKQVINGFALLLLAGLVQAAYAETGSAEPAVEIHAIESNAPTAVPGRSSESDATATPVKVESPMASQEAEANAPAAADVPTPKPGIIEQAVHGMADFFERVKAFVTGSDN